MACDKSDTSKSKTKVIFIIGATGTGKSKLAISLATRFSGEIINSDKIQVYDALPFITNRVTKDELSTVPHHLVAFVPRDDDFPSTDFICAALESISSIVSRGNLPIIAGGSLSFVEALLEDPKFCESHQRCFIWTDVDTNVLNNVLSDRVDKMVQHGLLEEARSVFDIEKDNHDKGVRRAIGVKEFDMYFRGELAGFLNRDLEWLLQEAVNKVKGNTYERATKQVEKIKLFCKVCGHQMMRVDLSKFFMEKLEGFVSIEEEEEVWERFVSVPSQKLVKDFLGVKNDDNHNGNLIHMLLNWLMQQKEMLNQTLLALDMEMKKMLKRDQ